MRKQFPTYFISHGGGPWPWIVDQMPGDWSRLTESLRVIPVEIGRTPRAVLVISAHWETDEFTVQTNPSPPMLYDYGGFPEFTYSVQYPAPGSPEVAARVLELLGDAGIAARTDGQRGFDHGMFAPMVVSWPEADVPMLQLSIRRDFDPDAHLAVGRALAPLRDEDVLLIGSGFSFHNLRLFGPQGREPSRAFDGWLADTMLRSDPIERVERLRHWEDAPSARLSHPTEDHLVPLFVAVGAAESEEAVRFYHEDDFWGGHLSSSSYRIGALPSAT